MGLITAIDVKRRLGALKGWGKHGLEIRRVYEFRDFMGSIGFVRKVAALAEERDHHPDIDIRWNKVTLTLSTHSEGGLTSKDFSMARLCNGILARRRAKR
jgi:4a-hydroxytetrahydrobiopterin dehydratase